MWIYPLERCSESRPQSEIIESYGDAGACVVVPLFSLLIRVLTVASTMQNRDGNTAKMICFGYDTPSTQYWSKICHPDNQSD